MTEDVYRRLAQVLDTLPNGFPATESGVELKLLKKIFTVEEADLFCDLRLTYETAGQIAERTGRALEGMDVLLNAMWARGEVEAKNTDSGRAFKMLPWIVGLYEYQRLRMDREFAELCDEYNMHFGLQFISHQPPVYLSIPVEKTIPLDHQALPYEKVSTLIENGKSFMVVDCICRVKSKIMGEECDKPLEVCLAIGNEPGVFEDHPLKGREITRDEAYEVLRVSEEAGLVHNTYNQSTDHWFICNCCGCCCGMVRAVRDFGLTGHFNTHFYAEIDPDLCTACGTCADDRCQVAAIEEDDEVYRVKRERCIGCGLCVSTCPEEAIRLIPKPPEELIVPPLNEEAWNDERAQARGVDYSRYR